MTWATLAPGNPKAKPTLWGRGMARFLLQGAAMRDRRLTVGEAQGGVPFSRMAWHREVRRQWPALIPAPFSCITSASHR